MDGWVDGEKKVLKEKTIDGDKKGLDRKKQVKKNKPKMI